MLLSPLFIVLSPPGELEYIIIFVYTIFVQIYLDTDPHLYSCFLYNVPHHTAAIIFPLKHILQTFF